jgi:hypothetical protein
VWRNVYIGPSSLYIGGTKLAITNGALTWSSGFGVTNATGSSKFFVNISSGNVGIGTTTPNYTFETAVTAKAVNLSSALYINGTIGCIGIGAMPHPNYKVRIQSGSYGDTALYVFGSSIGVWGAGMSLGVAGWADTGGADFDAVGPGTNYAATSSVRWKNNITEINPQVALGKILAIKGNYFNWTIYNNTHDMGFTAEDIGQIVPEVVWYEDNLSNPSNWYVDANGTERLYARGVDYGALTPMLVQAMKGQQDLIVSQNGTINQQNETINRMAASLCNLGASEWCSV